MLLKIKKYIVNSKNVRHGHIYKQLFISLLAGFSSLSYGIQYGWMSPVQKLLQSHQSPTGTPLTDGQTSWVASAISIAGIFGGFIHMYIADIHGRKKALILTHVLQAVSWIILLISSNFSSLIIARICAGVGASGSFILVPMYITETCQDSLRGSLVSVCLSSTQYFGILIGYLMGSYLNYHVAMWISLCFILITIVLTIIASLETPPFLIKKQKVQEATKIVASLRGLNINDKTVKEEINCMITQDEYNKSCPSLSFIAILKNKAWRRGYIYCSLILAGMSFNGSIGIVTYAHKIIDQCGTSLNAELQTLSVPILMILGSIVPLTCADKAGRKPLLLGMYILCSVSLSVLASYLLMRKYGIMLPSFVPVVAMAATVCAYSMGIMSMSYVIMSDIFKFEVRAKLMGIILAQVWFLISTQVFFVNFMSNYIGFYGVFYIFAAVNLITGISVAIFVPETKGKTREQIESILLGNKIESVPIPGST